MVRPYAAADGLSDWRRAWRSRSHHRARARLPRDGRRRPLRPAGAPGAVPSRTAKRRTYRGRHGRARRNGAGSDLLSAGREGPRRPNGRTPQVGRSVRLRSRRRRGALSSRAGCPVRGRAGDPGGDRHSRLLGRPAHLPWRRRHGHAGARPRGRKPDRAGGRLGQPREAERDDRLLRGHQAAAGNSRRADLARDEQDGIGGGHLRGHAAWPADRRRHAGRTGRAHCAFASETAGDSRRRPRRRASAASPLVRRTSALRPARRGHAAARRRGRSRRSTGVARCRYGGSADDPDHGARGLVAARSRGGRRRAATRGSCSPA